MYDKQTFCTIHNFKQYCSLLRYGQLYLMDSLSLGFAIHLSQQNYSRNRMDPSFGFITTDAIRRFH